MKEMESRKDKRREKIKFKKLKEKEAGKGMVKEERVVGAQTASRHCRSDAAWEQLVPVLLPPVTYIGGHSYNVGRSRTSLINFLKPHLREEKQAFECMQMGTVAAERRVCRNLLGREGLVEASGISHPIAWQGKGHLLEPLSSHMANTYCPKRVRT